VSYCRFSCENFGSDIYCYCDSRSIVIHVAARRHTAATPMPALPTGYWDMPAKDMQAILDAQRQWLESAQHTRIGLPEDGHTFLVSTPAEALNKLIALRQAGYRVPEHALVALRADAQARAMPA
jgi:hypothetical protein